MKMEINDIQPIKQGILEMFEITFADEETRDDCAKIIISKNDMWQISHYCTDELSYRAQIKNGKVSKPIKTNQKDSKLEII